MGEDKNAGVGEGKSEGVGEGKSEGKGEGMDKQTSKKAARTDPWLSLRHKSLLWEGVRT